MLFLSVDHMKNAYITEEICKQHCKNREADVSRALAWYALCWDACSVVWPVCLGLQGCASLSPHARGGGPGSRSGVSLTLDLGSESLSCYMSGCWISGLQLGIHRLAIPCNSRLGGNLSHCLGSNGVVGDSNISVAHWWANVAALWNHLGVRKSSNSWRLGPRLVCSEFTGIDCGPDAGVLKNLPDDPNMQQRWELLLCNNAEC